MFIHVVESEHREEELLSISLFTDDKTKAQRGLAKGPRNNKKSKTDSA